MIIVLIIILLGGFFLVAFLLAGVVLHAQGKAKKQARAILAGETVSPKQLKRIKQTLSVIKNDTEAAYLWHKLEELG